MPKKATSRKNAEIGHNSLNVGELKGILDKADKIKGEIDDHASDLRDHWAEAKAKGYNVKALKAAMKLRDMDSEKRLAEMGDIGLYCNALGIEIDPYS
jgi:uncharacterized protein (UPF0335 family)